MSTVENLWGHDLAKGVELEKKADEEKNIPAKAKLYKEAALRYKLAQSWDEAITALCQSANCYKEINKLREAADMYMEAGRTSWRINAQEAASSFDQAIELLVKIKNISAAANYCWEAGILFKLTEDYKHSLDFYTRSVHLFECTCCFSKRNKSQERSKEVASALKWNNFLMQAKMALTKCLCSPLDLVGSLFAKCLVGEYKDIK